MAEDDAQNRLGYKQCRREQKLNLLIYKSLYMYFDKADV